MKKNQIPISKSQIISNNQYPNSWFGIYNLKFIWCLGFVIWNLILSGCSNPQLYSDTRVMMGTYVKITSPEEKAINIAFDEINRIEKLMNKYDPQSEISILNHQGELKVSPETMYVLNKSREFWKATDGAFDLTIAPLMDLWGFTKKEHIKPNPEEIKNTLEKVGFDKVDLNLNDNMVKFKIPGMKIDLGAIAKGFAIDKAIKALKKNKINSCLINAGGDIYALGNKFGNPWNIAIQDPKDRNSFSGTFELEDKAAVTSGDYEQFFIQNNQRYSHIFNPKTGYPENSRVITVTIIGPQAMTADALATSVMVLGKNKAESLLNKYPDYQIMFIEENVSDNQ